MLCQCLCLCLYLWLRWCSGRRLILQWGLAAPWAAARPRVVRAASLTARSGRSRSPARPRHRPWAPQPGPASKPARALRSLRRPPHRRRRIADVCSARRLVVRPGPATAHGHRSQASPRSPARPCHRLRAPQPGPASKPARALRSLRRPPHRRRMWFWLPGPRRRLWVLRRVPMKEISPQLGALVRGTALH